MSRTPDNDRSNPLSRMFSKFLERGDVSKDKPTADTRSRTATPPSGQQRPAARTAPAQRGIDPSQMGTTVGTTAGGTMAGGATAANLPPASRPDFSNVRSGTSSVPAGDASTGQSSQPRTHTVQKGDTLSKIAQEAYGRADRWKPIFDANRDKLDDPDRIYPGQVLVIPDLPNLH